MKYVKPSDFIDDVEPVNINYAPEQQHGWNALYREAVDQAAIVAITNRSGRILSVNDKFCQISGYSKAELIGANHRLVRSGHHDRAFFRNLYRTLLAGKVWHGEICNRTKSGQLYWVDTTIVPHKDTKGIIDTFTAIRFDVTEKKFAEGRLWNLANIDPLTNLPNRLSFMTRLQDLTLTAKANNIVVGLMDIDHFKEINDSLGHAAGDELLTEIARRLRAALKPADVIARLGGDEFALVFLDCPNIEDKEERIARIYAALSKPVWLDGEKRRISASLGVARIANEGSTAAELLRHADIALYAAKDLGRGQPKYFCAQMRADVDRRAALMSRFSKGLEDGEFCVHYQPITQLDGHRVAKAEALLRWQHPELGLIGPNDFSEALADESLAAAADAKVLEIVLNDIAAWKRNGQNCLMVAINATIGDFNKAGYIERIIEAIEHGTIAPSDLCVEITEGMLIGHRGSAARAGIERLHAYGVGIAFDDFGTGFASLRHLRDLPVDYVKIDYSFIRALGRDAADWAVVEGIIRMAHRLGKTVIAEGVETERQVGILRELRCDLMQGFLVARPMPADDLVSQEQSLFLE